MVFFIFILSLYKAVKTSALLCLQQKPRKCFKCHLLAESESASHSARLLFLLYADICMYSFYKTEVGPFCFCFQFRNDTILFRLKTAHMLHVCSISVWITIQMQRLPLIFNGKSTDRALFCLYEDICFNCVTYLFDFGLVFKLQFSFVIYIYIRFTFSYLAEPFIQSDLQMSTIEEIKTNKRPIISKCYINIL